MKRKFQVGDKVRLVSDTQGCTPMTVRGYADDIAKKDGISSPFIGEFLEQMEGEVICDWRDSYGQPCKRNYHENELLNC